MATPVGSVIPVSNDPFLAGLIQGGRWFFSGAPVLTYSEHSDPPAGAYWTAELSNGYAQAFVEWANVANVSFRKIVAPALLTQTSADVALSLFMDAAEPSLVSLTFPPDPAIADRILSASGLSRAIYPQPEGDMFFNLASGYPSYIQPGGVGRWAAVHEIGHVLGLKHPFDDGANDRPTFSALGIGAYDAGFWTVMSYENINAARADRGHQATPMPLDIKAVQAIYGANTGYRLGNDVYLLLDDGVVRTIWDAGGIDAFDASGSTTAGATLTLVPGGFSRVGNDSATAIAFDVAIETAIGSNFADTILGNDLANHLEGRGGDDTLIGGAGPDSLDGGDGSADVAVYSAGRSGYTALRAPGAVMTVGHDGGAEGVDRLWSVEWLRFADQTVPTSTADSSLEYIASYGDLMAALGANPGAGIDHYAAAGYYEGRRVAFDALEYVASYTDLMNAFGASDEGGAAHYITAGRFEGRHISFDGLEYIASYEDLISAFGPNADAGASHYIQSGRFEGRQVSFDGLQYIASYPDLIIAFHNDVAATADADIGANHYIVAGYFEQRDRDLFNAAQYLAKYADLQAAFGGNLEAASLHFITAGYFEGRTDDPLA